MEKFSKVKKRYNIDKSNDKNVQYDDNYIKVVSYEDWSIVSEKDVVVCIPYFIETNQFIIRNEYVPTYKYRDKSEYHVTILAGTIEDNESPEDTLFRELQEEAGLVLRDDYKFDINPPLFVSKGNTSKYYYCIVPLTERDYHEVLIKGDGSKVEKMSKTVKVDVKYINSIMVSDLITKFMLEEFKKYLNLE